MEKMVFKCFFFCLLLHFLTFQVSSSNLTNVNTEIKKILILGATGEAGLETVKEALHRGLQVKAFSRNPKRLPQDIRDKVEAVPGDIHNYEDVHKAVKGVDAVIVAVSPRGLNDTDKNNYMTRGLQNVIRAMEAENIEIVNAVLSAGLIAPEEAPDIYKADIEDHRIMYNALQSSDLKFIASCPPLFIGGLYNQILTSQGVNTWLVENERKSKRSTRRLFTLDSDTEGATIFYLLEKKLKRASLLFLSLMAETPADAYEVEINRMPGSGTTLDQVISRNQLAKFSIDSLTQSKYYRQKVGVRNKPTVITSEV